MGKGTRRGRWILKWTCLWVFVHWGRRCEEEYCEGWLRATSSQGTKQDDQIYLLCYRQQAIRPDQLFEWNSSYIFYTNHKKILNTYVIDWLGDICLKLAKNIFPIFWRGNTCLWLLGSVQSLLLLGWSMTYILCSSKLNLVRTGE